MCLFYFYVSIFLCINLINLTREKERHKEKETDGQMDRQIDLHTEWKWTLLFWEQKDGKHSIRGNVQ